MNKRRMGTAYEEVAAAYLRTQGIKIIKKNYRIKQGEVDLIGEDASHLIFFEVKYRKDLQYGEPYLSITEAKKRKISNVSRYYLWRYPTGKQIRYDVICICKEKISWFQNAFEYQGYY